MALEARVASTISTEQVWVNVVLSPDVERVWRWTRHTQEELKVPRVPWDLKGAGLFLSWRGYGEHMGDGQGLSCSRASKLSRSPRPSSGILARSPRPAALKLQKELWQQ